MDSFGFIKVNSRLETNVPGIWALGDVKGGPAFTHISYKRFSNCGRKSYAREKPDDENRIVPYSVFHRSSIGPRGHDGERGPCERLPAEDR